MKWFSHLAAKWCIIVQNAVIANRISSKSKNIWWKFFYRGLLPSLMEKANICVIEFWLQRDKKEKWRYYYSLETRMKHGRRDAIACH